MNRRVQTQEAAVPLAPVTLDLTVRFAETDLMGIVHHSTYVIWFEAGRVAWMAAAGIPYTEISGLGRHFAVTGLRAEYRAAARFGDVVRVTTHLARLRSRHVAFAYNITRVGAGDGLDGELLATGESEHICVDLDGRMATIPPPIAARLLAGATQLAQGQP